MKLSWEGFVTDHWVKRIVRVDRSGFCCKKVWVFLGLTKRVIWLSRFLLGNMVI